MIQKIHEVQTTLINEKEEKILNRKAAQKRVFEKHFRYPTQKDKSIENSNKLELPVPILNSKEIKTEPGEDMENVPNSNANEIGHEPNQNTPLDILATEQKEVEQNKMSKIYVCLLKIGLMHTIKTRNMIYFSIIGEKHPNEELKPFLVKFKKVEMIEQIPKSQQTNMEQNDEDIEISNLKTKNFSKKNSFDDMFREIPTTKLIKTEPEDIITSRTNIKKPRLDIEVQEEEDEIGKNMPLKNSTSSC